MTDIQIVSDIKKLGGLLKKFSIISDSSFVLFPSEDSSYEMPADKYFEIMQWVFNNPVTLIAVRN